MEQLDARYGKTDSERSWPWLNQFTEFDRQPNANIKYFRSRFLRTATRLGKLGMQMAEEMQPPNELQALKLGETQSPVYISALETNGSSRILETVTDVAIKMDETHRRRLDTSETYHAAGGGIWDITYRRDRAR